MQSEEIALLIVVPIAAVIGDFWQQRVLRVVHNGNYRRTLTSLSLMSCLVSFLCIMFLQVALSSSGQSAFTEQLRPNSSSRSITSALVDSCAKLNSSSCFFQTPQNLFLLLQEQALLFAFLGISVLYFFPLAVILRHASGVVFATASGILALALGHTATNPDSRGAMALAIFGALFVAFEWRPPTLQQRRQIRRQRVASSAYDVSEDLDRFAGRAVSADIEDDDGDFEEDENAHMITDEQSDNLPLNDENFRVSVSEAEDAGCCWKLFSGFVRFFRALLPLLLLGAASIATIALVWKTHTDAGLHRGAFVTNSFGLFSAQQSLLPLALLPVILMWDIKRCLCGQGAPTGSVPWARAHALLGDSHQESHEEGFAAMFKHTMKEFVANGSNIFEVLFARLFSCGAALGYLMILTRHHAPLKLFGEVLLIQLALAWTISQILSRWVPSFANLKPEERRLPRWNVVVQGLGCMMLCGAVMLVHAARTQQNGPGYTSKKSNV